MANTDAELEQQLKEAGKQLSRHSDSVAALLSLLDQIEKLLSKVDQSPKKSMLDALKPSMKALIQESLLKHSDVDVKVAVAACVSEITRITAPDAPYDDDQMRDIFQLIVSSFEDIADQASRSYIKRASILETVSKVRSCVIMLDLECDALIVEMFEHFLRSVRDYHHESIYPSMESIMVLVLEESEEIPVEMLKPLLASVKKDSEGVLPVARKLAEGVLLKSADKLKPYLMPAIVSLGDTLDKYTEVVASICEGKTATVEQNDEIASEANERKLEKESVDEAPQADESKLTTASSEHTKQVVKGDSAEEVDPTIDRSPKSVMSNGVNVLGNEEASVDQEPPKKPEDEDTNQQSLNKEDTDDSGADKELKPEEQTSENGGKKSDAVINSAEPSDSSHVEGDKEADKPSSEIEKDNDVKESESGAVIPSEIEKDNDVQVSSPKPVESKPASVTSPSQSNSLPDESRAKKAAQSKNKQVPQEDEIVSQSKSETPPDETRSKKGGQPKKDDTQEDASEETGDLDIKPQKRIGKKAVASKEVEPPPKDESEDDEAASDSDAEPQKRTEKKAFDAEEEVKAPPKAGSEDDDVVSDSDAEPQKRAGKKAVATKEVKTQPKDESEDDAPPKDESEDDKATSESDAEPQKQAGKKAVAAKEVKLPSKGELEDDEATSESDAEPQIPIGKKAAVAKGVKLPPKDDTEDDEATSESDAKPQKRTKKVAAAKDVKHPPKDESADDEATSESDAPPPRKTVSKSTKQPDKKSKLSGKKSDVVELNAKKQKQTGKKVTAKVEDSDSEAKPPKSSVKKGQKRKAAVEEEEESDSENKPLQLAAKKGKSKKQDDGRKRGSGKNATENDQAKAMSSDDEMDYSPKSAAKSAKGEGSSKEISTNSAKRKRSAVKEKVSDTIKYDKSLVGSKVKVWWPEDKTYYEGFIESFDAARKKHKVHYVDGEKETLNLRTEKWEFLNEYSVRDEEQNIEAESEEASPEIQKKKSKTDAAPSASQDKIKDSTKRTGGVPSSGKAKVPASKDNKSKDKSAAKSASQKSGGKSSDAATSSKSKKDEETPKAGTKTKQDTPKTVSKSKGKTPQTGSKSNANGPTKAKSNVKEHEDVKAPDSTKGKSTVTTKSGSKKRKHKS
uniref:dentin sialophosphoprotein-like isoform X2 n=1 Tax=Erigeron canadensis TaxID=72917 RepID=UPI001CB9AE85|nr:dentin sialophosphoprotein-like isoform X2 [Erigeron canadensis]